MDKYLDHLITLQHYNNQNDINEQTLQIEPHTHDSIHVLCDQ
jgi:hypothetical protein